MRSGLLAALLTLVASSAVAQDWGKVATISTTLGVSGSRVCIGETSRGDIGCPSYAPYVKSGGLVGIGTSNPNTQLEVVGTTSATALFTSYGTSTNGNLHWTLANGGGTRFGLGLLNTESGSNTGSNFGIWRYDDSSSLLGAALFIRRSDGQVGIGTSSPGAALDVAGTISASNVYVTGTTGVVSATYGYFTYISATNGAGSGSGDRIVSGTLSMLAISDTGYISLSTAGTNWGYFGSGLSYLPILSATTVGVSNTLNYAGQTVQNIAGGGGNYIVSATASVSTSSANGGTIKMATGSGLVMTVSGSGVGIGKVPVATLDVSGAIWLGRQIIFNQNDQTSHDYAVGRDYFSNNGHNFYVYDSVSGTARLFIDANGNVGIGTGGPGYHLHVAGADSTDANGTKTNAILGVAESSAESHGIYFRLKGISAGVGGSNYENQIIGFNGNGTSLYTNTGYLALGTADVDRMHIDNSGNVGIGTTSPISKLQVVGDTISYNYYNGMGNTAAGTWGADSGGSSAHIIMYGSAAANPDAMLFVNSGGERMRIIANGNVGIGTTGPGKPLEVDGSSGGGSGVIRMRDTGASAGLYWNFGPDSLNNVILYSNAGTGAYITAGGSTWNANSDRRLKTNIQFLPEHEGLEAILRLRPVTFNWKDVHASPENQVGFIAQDVAKVLPDLVSHAPDTSITLPNGKVEHLKDVLGLNYTGFVMPLVKAVQELKADNDNLRAEHNADHAAIETLRREIDQLKAARK